MRDFGIYMANVIADVAMAMAIAIAMVTPKRRHHSPPGAPDLHMYNAAGCSFTHLESPVLLHHRNLPRFPLFP